MTIIPFWGIFAQREDFAMGTKSVAVIVATVFGSLLWMFFRETAVAVAIEAAIDEFFTYMDWERGKMIVTAAPFVAMSVVAYALAFISYRLGEAERSKEPVMDIDPRVAFKNILNNERWLGQHTETNPNKLQHLVSNYLRIRLDGEIHDFLAQGKLAARGKRTLNMSDGPLDWIPKEEWHKVEILFSEPDDRTRCIAQDRKDKKTAYGGIMLSSRQLAKRFAMRRRLLFK
jgi:hypothetical protein